MATDPIILDRFKAQVFPELPDFKAMDAEQAEAWIKRLTGVPYKPKTPSRLWQTQGVAAACYAKRILWRYDMQLGKSKMALDAVSQFKAGGQFKGTGFVIAHSPVGLSVWQNQAIEHSDLDVRVAHLDLDKLFDLIADAPDLIVITWSGMQQMFCEKRLNRKKQPTLYANHKLLEALADCFSLVIIDEIHLTKNPWGLWFEMAAALVKRCSIRIGMTGTLLNRDMFDLWAQLKLVDGGERLGWSYNLFTEAFGKKEKNYAIGFSEMKFDKVNMPLISARLASCALEYDRAETGAIIKLNHGVVRLNMYGEQLEAYENALNNLIKMNDGSLEETDAHFVKLRQISSGFLPFIDSYDEKLVKRFKQSVKFEWLADFLANAPNDLQIVIFHEFTQSGRYICELLSKLKLSHTWMYGGSGPAEDAAAVKAFQAGKNRVFVANSKSGGTSIGLNAADYVLFFETPAAPITRTQAEARPNANRGDRALFIDDMICSPTERRILDFIAEGKDLVHELRTANNRKALLASLRV